MLFQYTPLPADTVRLVRILPNSTSTDLHFALKHQEGYTQPSVSFTALIYHASDSDARKAITLAGRSFMITAALWEILTQLWQDQILTGSDWFFVDQLCVNRRDESEVQAEDLVKKVFPYASTILAWLDGRDCGHVNSLIMAIQDQQPPHIESSETVPSFRETLPRQRTEHLETLQDMQSGTTIPFIRRVRIPGQNLTGHQPERVGKIILVKRGRANPTL